MKSLKIVVPAVLASASTLALAVPPDLTSMTTAVDFSTVAAAILGVAAALIGTYLTWRGAKFVINALKTM